MTVVVLRTILVYFVVFVVLRVMGRRELSKLSLFDLVFSLMLAEVAVFIIEDTDKSLWAGFAPLLALVVIQKGMAWIGLKSAFIRRCFDGEPRVLIERGALNQKEMNRQRYTLDDLLLQLRMKDVTAMSDIEMAILETNGQLSVLKKSQLQQDDKTDGQRHSYGGFPLFLIMDGRVQTDHLARIGCDQTWLENELKSRGILDIRQVFVCSLDYRGEFFINLKESQPFTTT